jgi:circadian clock protein KaiB
MTGGKNKKDATRVKVMLRLFVSGMSPKSMIAIKNVKRFCEEQLRHTYSLEIIDIYKNPEAASENQIIFSPSLIKDFPDPRRTLIGNFSDISKVIHGLGITNDE